MTDATSPDQVSVPRLISAGDVIVFLANTAVATAFAFGLHLQTGLPPLSAAIAGLVLHTLMFTGHYWLTRNDRSRPSAARPAKVRSPRTGSVKNREPQLGDAALAKSAKTAQPAARPDTRLPLGMETIGRDAVRPSAYEPPVLPTLNSQTDAYDTVFDTDKLARPLSFEDMIRDLASADQQSASLIPEPFLPTPAPSDSLASDARETMITASVAALRTAADAVHNFEQRPQSNGSANGQLQFLPLDPILEPAPVPSGAGLADIADALEAGRFQVAVTPILGLADQKAQHHEIEVRLSTRSGDVAVPADIEATTKGTGLLPLLEALKVGRALRVAADMQAKGAHGGLFSQITGEGLTSQRLIGALVAEQSNPASAATRVVLSFTQNEVRNFAPAQWSALADLADLGFRFGVDDVTNLEFDFEALRNLGFMFLKLDASVVLDGLALDNTIVAAEDLCRYFASLGLTLVVGRIDDQHALARVMGLGVLFGQGLMFGGPRPIELDDRDRSAAA